jgi:hypothetical protein
MSMEAVEVGLTAVEVVASSVSVVFSSRRAAPGQRD